MASSLSNLVDNITEEVHKVKCKYGHFYRKCEMCGIKYKDCGCCLENTKLTNTIQMATIGLFCCREKVFTHINTWMINKN